MSKAVIRRPAPADEARWRALWSAYLRFYRNPEQEAATATLWQEILRKDGKFSGFVAEVGGEVLGIVHYLFHDNTSSMQQVCYLQDLYVDPATRGSGAARALMDAVFEDAKGRGAFRVYWHTQEFNGPARSLYDTIVPRSSFIVYRKPL